jgi:hypothetical protein
MQNRVILYSTEGCHLCEQAEELVLSLAPAIDIEKVDIAYDDGLYERYRYCIPVLKNAANAELNWPFDTLTLKEFLS